jgi:glycine oxidase
MKIYDAVVIGGGIIGGSITFELARHGLRVVLLDRQKPGREASWAAGGMLSPSPHLPEDVLLVPFARASSALYREFISAVETATGRTTGYGTDGALELFLGPDAEEKRDQVVANLDRLGMEARAISGDQARRLEPELGPSVRAAALLPDEARVNVRELTDAVLQAAALHGAEIRAETEVVSILKNGGGVEGVVVAPAASAAAGKPVIAPRETLLANHVVLAAGCYSAQVGSIENLVPVRPIRGQMVALAMGSRSLRHTVRCELGYMVPWNNGRVIAGSTLEDAGFEKAVTPAGLRRILRAVTELAPAFDGAPIVETWSGLRPDTPDHLPLLGPTNIERLIVATGHYRNGILLAPGTATFVREWITNGGRISLPVEGFSPMRFLDQKRAASR